MAAVIHTRSNLCLVETLLRCEVMADLEKDAFMSQFLSGILFIQFYSVCSFSLYLFSCKEIIIEYLYSILQEDKHDGGLSYITIFHRHDKFRSITAK